jgi:hypothetical protein
MRVDRLVELGVVHLQAGLACELHLYPVHDHPFQQLALEYVLRRQIGVPCFCSCLSALASVAASRIA